MGAMMQLEAQGGRAESLTGWLGLLNRRVARWEVAEFVWLVAGSLGLFWLREVKVCAYLLKQVGHLHWLCQIVIAASGKGIALVGRPI